LPWFPSFLRDYGTDFLQFLANKAKIYKAALPILKKGIEKAGNQQIIDLASGGGGGLLWLNTELKKDFPKLKITLTDYYPNIDAFKRTKRKADNFEYVEEKVDAKEVPSELKGFRTQFLSFHHFKPKEAKAILQNAVNEKSPIAIFEAQERSLLSILGMVFSPLNVVFLTPFILPFKFGRILFTYLIPIVPAFVFWDGIVSCLRTYSVKEMKTLVSQLNDSNTFDWDIGRLKSGPGAVLYLLGTPK
jgi:hypothetical protein